MFGHFGQPFPNQDGRAEKKPHLESGLNQRDRAAGGFFLNYCTKLYPPEARQNFRRPGLFLLHLFRCCFAACLNGFLYFNANEIPPPDIRHRHICIPHQQRKRGSGTTPSGCAMAQCYMANQNESSNHARQYAPAPTSRGVNPISPSTAPAQASAAALSVNCMTGGPSVLYEHSPPSFS